MITEDLIFLKVMKESKEFNVAKELWEKLYAQQAVVRELMSKGDSSSDEFWKEHKKMVAIQDEIYFDHGNRR